MNSTDLLVSERGREREESLSPSFPSPLSPVLLSPPFSRHQTLEFFLLFFFSGSLSFFFFSVSKIGTCRIHAYLINSVFILTADRASVLEENQTLKQKIQELEKKNMNSQRDCQAPRTRYENSKTSKNPGAVKRRQQKR